MKLPGTRHVKRTRYYKTAADFMQSFVDMGEPSSVGNITGGHICDIHPCRKTAERLVVFTTGIVNCCETHYKEFEQRRRALWKRE